MLKALRLKLHSVFAGFLVLDIVILAMCIASIMNWLAFLTFNFSFLLGFFLVLDQAKRTRRNKKLISGLSPLAFSTFAVVLVGSVALILTTLLTQQNIIKIDLGIWLMGGFLVGFGSLSSETDDSSGVKARQET